MMTSLDPVALIEQLTWQLPLTVGMTLVLGAIGGLIPGRKPTTGDPTAAAPPDLTLTERAFSGAIAAVAVLVVATIETPLELVSSSLVAGYAGTALMSSLESRLLAVLAQRDRAAALQQREEIAADARALAAQVDAMASARGPAAVEAAERAAHEANDIRRRRGWL